MSNSLINYATGIGISLLRNAWGSSDVVSSKLLHVGGTLSVTYYTLYRPRPILVLNYMPVEVHGSPITFNNRPISKYIHKNMHIHEP